jgi:hypothetical protein
MFAVQEVKAGDFKVDKTGIVHAELVKFLWS